MREERGEKRVAIKRLLGPYSGLETRKQSGANGKSD